MSILDTTSGGPQRQVGPAARWFDDLSVGERIVTHGRTVTEADAVQWAMFTGDMNPMHVDDVFAAEHGIFGGKFPPGLMVVAMASGLKERLGIFAGTGLAILRQTVDYHAVVLVGDTIHVELVVAALEPRPLRRRGIVRFRYEIRKADGTLAIDGEWDMLVASATPDAEA